MRPITSAPDRDDFERIRQARYQENVVKSIMKHFGLPEELKWQLLDLSDQPDDVPRIEMVDFQHLTGFPMWLASREFPKRQPVNLIDVVRDFDRTHLFRALLAAIDNRPWNLVHLPFGLVFPVRGITQMVAHNRIRDSHAEGTRILINNKAGRSTLVIERLSDLLDAIAPLTDGGLWPDAFPG